MTRVLLVTHYYAEHRGGVEIVAGELARRLARRGAQITWVASDATQADGPEGVTRLPMRSWNITERRLGFPYPIWGPISLCKQIRAVAHAEVVHLHDCLYMGNVIAYLAARILGKRVIVTQHVGEIPYKSRVLRGLLAVANRTLGMLVLGGADQCVFISPRVRDYFSRLVRFRRPPLYRANGVATENFFPVSAEARRSLRARLSWPHDKLVLLFVGRFVEKKGLPFLRQLAERLPQFEWVFAGWGPEDPAKWGLGNVRFLGPQTQAALADFYRAADLLVLPSVGEGFPLVVQEAMACGLPAFILTETAEGAPDARELLFVEELIVDRWVGELQSLAADRGKLEAWRNRVAEFARSHWDWEACASEYLELFTVQKDSSS